MITLVYIFGGGILMLIGKYLWDKNKISRMNAKAVKRRQELKVVVEERKAAAKKSDAEVKEFDDAYKDYHSSSPKPPDNSSDS